MRFPTLRFSAEMIAYGYSIRQSITFLTGVKTIFTQLAANEEQMEPDWRARHQHPC